MNVDWRTREPALDTPLYPLQRRRELIEAYRRQDYPERAAHLERIDDGPPIAHKLLQGYEPKSLDAAVAWWTGWSGERATELRLSIDQVVEVDLQIKRFPDAEQLRRRRSGSLRASREIVEDALVDGLTARVNSRLRPLPPFLPPELSPSWVVYSLLVHVREWACGSKLEALTPLPRIQLPPPHREFRFAHVTVCAVCTAVDLRRRPANMCKLCRKQHARDGIIVPRLGVLSLPWLITGYRHVHLRACAKCGKPLFGNADARMHDACRVANFRQGGAVE